jgi:hypothetical protein
VDVKKIAGNVRPEPPPARGSQRARTMDFNGLNPGSTTSLPQNGPTPTSNPMARKMIAPQYPGHSPQMANLDGTRDPLNDLRRSASSASTHSLPALPYRASNTLPPQASSLQPNKPQVLRKTAPPPIPNKKPSLLSKTTSPSSSPAPQAYRDEPSLDESRPQPPPPRRSMATSSSATRKPVPNLIDGDERPALPPRTGTGLSAASNGSGRGGGRNLMDDEPEELRNLDGWEVLKPLR